MKRQAPAGKASSLGSICPRGRDFRSLFAQLTPRRASATDHRFAMHHFARTAVRAFHDALSLLMFGGASAPARTAKPKKTSTKTV
jgi:hypothetical protein